MRRVACIAAGAALSASFNASALGSLARVSLIDRDTGTAIAAHYFHGEYWVAGAPGPRYGIEIRNLSGGRLLAVTSVDGVNVLSGDTAAWNQSGYVFDPGERYQINGWRKSNSEVAGFTFTAADDSYAQRTGRPANVGVIGVALFREREAAAYSPPRIAESPYAPPPSPLVGGMPSAAAPAAADRARASSAESVVTSPKLGTGHGEREYSYVTDTQFQRLQSEPNEVIRIRYDSYENLVALGVIRAPRPRPPLPEPFPDSQGRQFVPDPPG
jgi:hypothetical protein